MFSLILESLLPKPNADTREESKQSSQHTTWPADNETAVLCTGLDFTAEKFGQLSKQKYELDRL